MTPVGTEVAALGPEHADGTIWADIEGDLWQPTMFGWVTIKWLPFAIVSQIASPGVEYGPYRAVLAAPDETDRPT